MENLRMGKGSTVNSKRNWPLQARELPAALPLVCLFLSCLQFHKRRVLAEQGIFFLITGRFSLRLAKTGNLPVSEAM